MKNCTVCDTPLTGRQRKFCSTKCCGKVKSKKFYNSNTGRVKKARHDIRQNNKEKLIAGRTCQNCGEFRHYTLAFHHLRDKKFVIGTKLHLTGKINELQKEANKCIILCKNCHNEEHNPNKFIDDLDLSNFKYQAKRGIERKLKLMEKWDNKCACCGYSKNLASFDFHHLNPEEKSFNLDSRHLYGRS